MACDLINCGKRLSINDFEEYTYMPIWSSSCLLMIQEPKHQGATRRGVVEQELVAAIAEASWRQRGAANPYSVQPTTTSTTTSSGEVPARDVHIANTGGALQTHRRLSEKTEDLTTTAHVLLLKGLHHPGWPLPPAGRATSMDGRGSGGKGRC